MNNQEERKSDTIGWIIGAFIIGILMCMFLVWMASKNPLKIESIRNQVIYDINDPFTEQKVLDYLNELHVKYPNVALAQMKLETANGTSVIFTYNNNLFGMKNPVKRPTTSLGEKNNHAYYSHWRQSVVDYALYQAFVSNPENISSEDDWLNYIGHMYAEDNKYKSKLITIRDSLAKK